MESSENKLGREKTPEVDIATYKLYLQAIQRLPEDLKTSVTNALDTVPQLVEKESNPRVFLRFENNDPEAAARRLANYWKDRVATFGERAFLPMDLSGEGLLTEPELDMLAAGSVVRLPNDQAGRPVICFAENRILSDWDPAKCRVLFPKVRFFQLARLVMDDSELCREKGVVLLRHFSVRSLDYSMITQGQKHLFNHSLCIKIHSIQICALPAYRSTNKIVPLVYKFYGKEVASRIHFHLEEHSATMMTQLEQQGFDASGIPTTLGGKWQYTCFKSWLRQQEISDNATLAQRRAAVASPISGACHDDLLQIDVPYADDALDDTGDLEALNAENMLLLEDLANTIHTDNLSADNLFDTLVEQIGSAFEQEEHLDEEELLTVQDIATDLAKKTDHIDATIEDVHVRVRFAFGVLAMIQEESQYSMAHLLKDSATETLLRDLLTEKSNEEVVKLPSHSTTSFTSQPSQFKSQKCESGVSEEAYSQTRTALGILAALEEATGTPFEKLLQSPEVESILRELVGPPVTSPAAGPTVESGGKQEMSVLLDVLADHVASSLQALAKSGSLTPEVSMYLLQSDQGGPPSWQEGAGDEATRVVGALLDSTFCMT